MGAYPIGYLYFVNYCKLGNMDVGQLTVRMGVWSDFHIQIAKWEKSPAKRTRFLVPYIEWLKNSLRYPENPGAEYKKTFVPPAEGKYEGSVLIRDASEAIAEEAFQRAKHMDLTVGSRELSKPTDRVRRIVKSLDSFVLVMMDMARFYQELTIDATKKFIKVDPLMIKELSRVRLSSRNHEKFDIKPDFEKKKTIVSVNPSKSKNWKDRFGNLHCDAYDHNDELRAIAMKMATCMDDEIYSVVQEIPRVIVDSAEILMRNYPAVTGMVERMVNYHLTISNCLNAELKELMHDGASEDVVETFEAEKEIFRRESISVLANQIRCFAKSNGGVEGVKLAFIAIGVCLNRIKKANDEGNTREISNFPFTVLKEEFLMMAYDCSVRHPEAFSDNDPGEIYEETRNYLDFCNFSDGDIAEFKDGEAEVDGKLAFAIGDEPVPDGTYTIREIDGGMYACKNLRQSLEEQIPKDISSKICFQTKGIEVEDEKAGQKANEELISKLEEAETIYLPGRVDDTKFAVFADDIFIGSVSNGRTVAGEKERNKAADFFKRRKGQHYRSCGITYHDEEGKMKASVFVILENTSCLMTKAELNRFAGVKVEKPVIKKEVVKNRQNKFAAMIQPRQ